MNERIFVAIDVETTGLQAGVDELIEVAAVKFRGDEILETYSQLVRPRQPVPLKITRLTGITPEDLADAPRFNEIGADLARFIKSYPIVGHSVSFDLGMLRAQGMNFAQPSYDTFELATLLIPQAPIYKLGALAARLGIAHVDAHRALDDARATAHLFTHLLGLIQRIPLNELNEFVRLSGKIPFTMRDLFEEALRAKVKRAFEPPPDGWPTPDDEERPEPTPLKPTGDASPIDRDAVATFFAPEGPLGRQFDGYEPREPQVAMALAVADAFNHDDQVLIEAGTGTGKCVSGDTWITFASGRRMQIGELCALPELPDEPVLSLSASGKLITQRIESTHRNGVRPVWRLRTALGRTIIATANHPFLRADGWRNLAELAVGDRIATPRLLPAGTDTTLSHAAFVVGAMLGDGSCIYPDGLVFTNFDPDVVAKVTAEVAQLGNVQLLPTKRQGLYRFRRLSIMGKQRSGLNILLEQLDVLGRSSHTKCIPDAFFTADSETIARLLAGLWVTDGTIEKRDGHPAITFASQRLVRDLQHLLLKLGVIARLRAKAARTAGKTFQAWTLTISDLESKRNFWRHVGPHLVGQRRRALDAWWEEHQDQRYNPNDDLIPTVGWELVDHERQRAGASWYAIRQSCVVASDRTRELSRAKMQAIGTYLDSPPLINLAASDVYWDRVVAIEPLGQTETFDITMAGEPNFIANDLVVHNSLAYLTPAAMFAASRGERVVVSTNTINLQDQLYFKDIPALQRIMAGEPGSPGSPGQRSGVGEPGSPAGPRQHGGVGEPGSPTSPPFTAALLKGRGNYLCLKRYNDLRRSESLAPEEVRTLLKVQLWLPTTTSGDKAELLLMDREAAAWSRVNTTPETCTGPRCAHFRECFYFRARREAEAAHILVVNHALLIADLASQANVLPPYQHLVIDEAHNLEDVATDQLSFAVDQAALLKFLDDLFQTGGVQVVSGLLSELPTYMREGAADPAVRERIEHAAELIRPAIARARTAVYDCFNRLMAFVANEVSDNQYDPRLRLTPKVRQSEGWQEIQVVWSNLSDILMVIGEGLGRIDSQLRELEDSDVPGYNELMLRVEHLARYAVEVRVNTGHIVFGDEERICWLTHDRMRDTLTLTAAPLSVAEILQAQLFAQKQTSVLASATLTIEGGFSFVKGRLGLPEADELVLDSPFDYEHQALVYIPSDIPEPNQRGYQQAVEQALVELCEATGGRTLALFTANSALKQTYAAIQEPLEEHEITVLGQGIDGSRRTLLERFKESPRTVLLGTTSFWEGVDVVGDALSVLVIAKLPFSVPTDPIYAARSEQYGKDAFDRYSVPQSILRFKQGFGRLIRSREDRGIVVVLDKRLISKKYGQQFLGSLPNTKVRTGPLRQLPLLAARFLV